MAEPGIPDTVTVDPGGQPAIGAATAATTMPRRRGRTFGPAKLGLWGPPIGLLALLVAGAYGLHYALGERAFLLPEPHVVLARLWDPSSAPDLWEGLWNTTVVAIAGLAIAIVIGVVWAIVMNLARWAERTLFPYAVVLQAIPILAIVPLIGFWFGYDFFARTVVCVLIALFPMVSNTLFGLQSVDRGHRELFMLQGASRWIVLTKLELPAATPAIFAGMRISAGLSVVGAIVGDFFFQRGTPGIGALISKFGARLQSADLFASILLASLLGVAIFLIFGWLGRRAVGKWYDFG